jgi:hypothetical protein
MANKITAVQHREKLGGAIHAGISQSCSACFRVHYHRHRGWELFQKKAQKIGGVRQQ